MTHRMLSLREAVCHSDNLALAYARHARHRGLWMPGVPMSMVARAPVPPMLALAEELRGDRYRPHPPRIIPIAKADGGKRDISVYMIRDRVAQRALVQVMQQRTDAAMAPFSFGYRPARSVSMALASVRAYLDAGYCWVLDADVEHCFDSIPHAPLLAEVERRLGERAAPALVSRYLSWNRETRRTGVGIPQGSGLAPWLCNVYLWRLDDRVRSAGIPMVRYADDFVLLARTREAIGQAQSLCAETLGAMRLRLHPLKTRIVEAAESFRFLGQRLGPAAGGTRP